MACCARIIAPSITPRESMTSDRTTYMMPIFLWSRLVSHSRQSQPQRPAQVTRPATASAPITTSEAAVVAMAL